MSIFDKHKARLSFDRAAYKYDQSAHLQQQVAKRLIALEAQRGVVPVSILDIGCGTGQVTEAMCAEYPASNVVALDFAKRMLHQTEQRLESKNLSATMICADADQLPFTPNSFDLIISSLMLQWANDLQGTLSRCRETLNDQGRMLFSTFTQGTLKEVQQCWLTVDESAHTSHFLAKDALQMCAESAGFSRVKMHHETITMMYPSVRDMIMEMKHIGASNAHQDRQRGLTGKQRFKAFEEAFETYRQEDGQYPCTWELAYVICDK